MFIILKSPFFFIFVKQTLYATQTYFFLYILHIPELGKYIFIQGIIKGGHVA